MARCLLCECEALGWGPWDAGLGGTCLKPVLGKRGRQIRGAPYAVTLAESGSPNEESLGGRREHYPC